MPPAVKPGTTYCEQGTAEKQPLVADVVIPVETLRKKLDLCM